jgi:hypothetical protein
MKKYLLLLLPLFGKSQTVDTTIIFATAAKINHVYFKSGFPQKTDTLTHLGFFNYIDDLKGNCTVNYTLIAKDRNAITGSYAIKREEYDMWDSSVNGLLVILANYLNVVFK